MRSADIIKNIEDINFSKLLSIKFDGGMLTSMEGLYWVHMPCLVELYLRSNHITKIRVLRKTNLPIYWLSTSMTIFYLVGAEFNDLDTLTEMKTP